MPSLRNVDGRNAAAAAVGTIRLIVVILRGSRSFSFDDGRYEDSDGDGLRVLTAELDAGEAPLFVGAERQSGITTTSDAGAKRLCARERDVARELDGHLVRRDRRRHRESDAVEASNLRALLGSARRAQVEGDANRGEGE